MARNALPSATLSSISTFKKAKQAPPTTPPTADRNRESTCPDCSASFKIFTEGARGWKTKPHQVCITCYRVRRQRQRRKRSPQAPSSKVQAVESDPISQIGAFQAVESPSQSKCCDNASTTHGSVGKPLTLSHHIFTKGEWRRARLRDHPRIPITIQLDSLGRKGNASSDDGLTPHADVSAIADTGAQSDLWALSNFLACGFSRDDLHPIKMSLSAANRSPISIEGAFFAKLTTQSPTGDESSCRSMIYVSSSVQDMYLSYESLLNLGLLTSGFPSIPTADNLDQHRAESNELRCGHHFAKPNVYLPTASGTTTTADGATISLHTGKQQTDESMAPRTIRILDVQHLSPPTAALHGGPPDRNTCRACCHTQGLPYPGQHSPSLAAESLRRPSS